MIKDLIRQEPVSADALPAINAQNLAVSAADVLVFTTALSRQLMTSSDCRQYPELIALGHWLRQGNLNALTANIAKQSYRPLGLVVHYTPANVDTMFIYSWICALLMGNRNLVRVSGRDSDVQTVLLEKLRYLLLLSEHAAIHAGNQFIHFERDDPAGPSVSMLADARVLWGGDDSVRQIRGLSCKPRCRDISFADRFSTALINVDALNSDGAQSADEKAEAMASALWRECDMFQQQACSSPRILFWTGEKHNWNTLTRALSGIAVQHAPSMVQRNEQLVLAQWCIADGAASTAEQCGDLSLVHINHWHHTLLERHQGHSTLFCIHIDDVQAIAGYDHAGWQTLSYAGFEKEALFKIIRALPIQGIDRVVPLGNALAFSPDWDGYDLFSQLGRKVVFE